MHRFVGLRRVGLHVLEYSRFMVRRQRQTGCSPQLGSLAETTTRFEGSTGEHKTIFRSVDTQANLALQEKGNACLNAISPQVEVTAGIAVKTLDARATAGVEGPFCAQ